MTPLLDHRSHRGNPQDPPALADLYSVARRIGYENPLVEIGDMLDAETGRRVGGVRVQLWGNPVRRNVAAQCPVRFGMSEELAVRSALAEALILAVDRSALTGGSG